MKAVRNRLEQKVWRVAAVGVVAFLVALPITAIRAFYQPVGASSFLTTVAVGLCYGFAYVVVFDAVLPALVRRMGAERRGTVLNALLGMTGLAAGIGLGGSVNEIVTGWMGVSTAQHWWVGGSILVIARLLQLDHEALHRRIDEKILSEERLRYQAARAELQALQARADPHFLFNSLNMIAGLIEEDPKQAVDVVTRLAALYQYTLRASRMPTVALSEEIEAVATFLEIHALRFEDRISYTIEVDESLATVPVPSLCLQPLVENAVLHGAGDRGDNVTVRVSARTEGATLHLLVEDDGPGPGASSHRGSGTALADLEERLALVSDGRVRLATGARQPRGFFSRVEVSPVAAVGQGGTT